MKQIKLISTEFNYQIEKQTNDFLENLLEFDIKNSNVEIKMFEKYDKKDNYTSYFHSIITFDVKNNQIEKLDQIMQNGDLENL